MSVQNQKLPDNPHIEVIKSGKTGLFTNYIFKAIPLAFDESLSYYECLCGLLDYLKNVIIPTVNNNADAVAELQTLYEELRSYVDNYFKNLDVQEEINNKLDEMVESGELQEIISAYLNSKAVFGYDNVNEMKNATNLINGSYAETFGFYNVNDGGGAIYKIRNITNEDVVDNKFILAMTNQTLVAELIINNNKVNIKTIGGTTENDIHDYVLAIINKNYECFIPQGIWKTSPLQIAKYNSTRISGYSVLANNNSNGTIIQPIGNQDYIMKIGYDNTTSQCCDVNIENIQFSTGGFTCINALYIYRVGFSNFNELTFRDCKCSESALKIVEMWETRWGRSLFRVIDSPYALIFGNKIGSGNISTDYFEYLSFEGCRGNCVKFEENSAYSMSTIDTIDFESGIVAFSDESRVSINDVQDYTSLCIIETGNGKGEISINNFNVNAIAQHAYINSVTGNIRAFDTLIRCSNNDTGYFSFAIGTVSGVGNIKKPILIDAVSIDKFYLNNFIFQGGTYFNANVNNCRVFEYLPNEFINNYITSHLDIANRDLKINNLRPYCKGATGRAVRVASLITKSDKLYVHAKGNGRISYGGSDHVTLTNVEEYQWFEIPMEVSQIGDAVNLLLGTNSTVELDDYFWG